MGLDPPSEAEPQTTGPSDQVRRAVGDAMRGQLERIAREIELCLRYYCVTFRGQGPVRVRLVGGEACNGLVQAMIKAMLSLPVEVGRPLHSVDLRGMDPSLRRGPMSDWAVALGLGLKRAQGYFGPRDGRPRDPGDPASEMGTQSGRPTLAEVVEVDGSALEVGRSKLNGERSSGDPKQTANVQHSTSSGQRSTSNVQHSTSNVQRPDPNPEPRTPNLAHAAGPSDTEVSHA